MKDESGPLKKGILAKIDGRYLFNLYRSILKCNKKFFHFRFGYCFRSDDFTLAAVTPADFKFVWIDTVEQRLLARLKLANRIA